MKKAYLSVVLTLLMVCSVSAFSFQDVLAGSLADMVTGRSSVMNSLPDTNLNVPTHSQVVSGTKIKVVWSYFDDDGDRQQAYLIQFSPGDYSFDMPINLGGIGDENSDVVDVRKGGHYYVRVKTKDSYGWGDWSETRRIFVDAESKSCSEGTSYWQCSRTAPAYCDGGVLVDNCIKCGCPANQKCATSGVCVRQTCVDGTEYGFCSDKKPKNCMNGQLTEICSLCGCPEGKTCLPDGTCALKDVQVLEKGESASILERVAGFFKGLFGGLFK